MDEKNDEHVLMFAHGFGWRGDCEREYLAVSGGWHASSMAA